MAHSHQTHRSHLVEKQRVSHITRGYAHGGKVHDDEAEDEKLIRKEVKPSALKKRAAGGRIEGRAAGGRLDRGGRKKKGGTHVNVIVAPGAGGAGATPVAPPSPVGAAPVPVPPPRPPMMPPGAPMAGPGMPPGMPPRAHGGRVQRTSGGRIKNGPAWAEGLRNGTQVQHVPGNSDGERIAEHKGVKKVRTFAKGGSVYPHMRYGAGGGEGRLEKARKATKGMVP
jgi:hypothetical protein